MSDISKFCNRCEIINKIISSDSEIIKIVSNKKLLNEFYGVMDKIDDFMIASKNINEEKKKMNIEKSVEQVNKNINDNDIEGFINIFTIYSVNIDNKTFKIINRIISFQKTYNHFCIIFSNIYI